MPDPTYIELVKFSAEGIEEIELQTKGLEDAIKSAYARQEAMAKLLKNPAYIEAAKATEQLAEANRRALKPAIVELTAVEKERQRLTERGSALRSGAYRKEAAELAGLRKEAGRLAVAERRDRLASGQFASAARDAGRLRHDDTRLGLAERRTMFGSGQYLRDARADVGHKLTGDRLSLRERQQVLSSGLYTKHAAAAGKIGHEAAQTGLAERRALLASGEFGTGVARRDALQQQEKAVSRAERKAELQTLHGGAVGGGLYAAERARPAMLAAAGVGGGVLAMGRSGFGGTVEKNAFDMELKLINREIANALVPALRELTSGLRFVRRNLERLGPGGQKVLAAGAIGAAGLGTAAVGAAGVGHLLNGLRGLGMFGGRAAAAAGGNVVAQVATQAAGTAAGNVAGNAAGNAIGGAATGAVAAKSAGKLGGAGRALGGAAKLLPWVAAGVSVYEGVTGGYYEQKRKEGNNKVVSGLAALGGGFADTLTTPLEWFGGESFGTHYKKKHGIKSDGQKSSAMIADAGFTDFDSAYKNVQTAVSLQDAQNAESKRNTSANSDSSVTGSSTGDIILTTVCPLLTTLVKLTQDSNNANPKPLR